MKWNEETWLHWKYEKRMGNPTAIQSAKNLSKLLKRLGKSEFSPQLGEVEVLVFAGTANQEIALRETVTELSKQHVVGLVTHPSLRLAGLSAPNVRSGSMWSGRRERWRALAISVLRFPLLLAQAWSGQTRSPLNRALELARAHGALVYFGRLLRGAKPSLVLVSNDHLVENRSLVYQARRRGITTAYLQHASVARDFPPLEFDLSFLDGIVARDMYQSAENLLPTRARSQMRRQVVLSGNKRPLTVEDASRGDRVGIAINPLSDLSRVESFVESLSELGRLMTLRFHPAIELTVVRDLLASWNKFELEVSDPKVDSLGNFLARLAVLVAGDSNIHLEASLLGVPSIMVPMEKEWIDVYEFARNGLVPFCSDDLALSWWVHRALIQGEPWVTAEVVRQYSDTFGTPWHRREGELVAHCLNEVLKTGALPDSLPDGTTVRSFQL